MIITVIALHIAKEIMDEYSNNKIKVN